MNIDCREYKEYQYLFPEMQKSLTPTSTSTNQITPFVLDMKNANNLSTTINTLYSATINDGIERLIIINNAGVCLEGNTLNVLEETLKVNCLSPAFISEYFISYFLSTFSGETCGEIYENNLVDKLVLLKELVIVNISSGDGEVVYLHSDIQKQLNAITTYQVNNDNN